MKTTILAISLNICDNINMSSYFVMVPSMSDYALATTCALVLSGDTKDHIIWALLKAQTRL